MRRNLARGFVAREWCTPGLRKGSGRLIGRHPPVLAVLRDFHAEAVIDCLLESDPDLRNKVEVLQVHTPPGGQGVASGAPAGVRVSVVTMAGGILCLLAAGSGGVQDSLGSRRAARRSAVQ